MKPDEGKSSIASALARKAMRITTHDDGLIKNTNGHIEAGTMPDWPALPELWLTQPRLNCAPPRRLYCFANFIAIN
jgi:hypothetical protein